MMANSTLPTVDLSAFFREGDDGEKKKAAVQIGEACSEYGFFLAVNHGMPLHLMSRALQVSKSFFGCQAEEKLECSPKPGGTLPAGYFTSPKQSIERNEQFLMLPPSSGLNQYPKNQPEFQEVLEEIFYWFSKLGILVEGIVNDCLGLPPNFLNKYNNDRTMDFLLGLHYFPATESTETESIGKSAHKDGNSITFVFQEDVGGLEVLKDGQWITIIPPKGSLVVNIGDIIQVLSNDKFKSVTHRVVEQLRKDRYSYVFFYNLHEDKWVEPLPCFTNDIGVSPKYRGFHFKEYLKLRVRNRIHPPARPEDLFGINYFAI